MKSCFTTISGSRSWSDVGFVFGTLLNPKVNPYNFSTSLACVRLRTFWSHKPLSRPVKHFTLFVLLCHSLSGKIWNKCKNIATWEFLDVNMKYMYRTHVKLLIYNYILSSVLSYTYIYICIFAYTCVWYIALHILRSIILTLENLIVPFKEEPWICPCWLGVNR